MSDHTDTSEFYSLQAERDALLAELDEWKRVYTERRTLDESDAEAKCAALLAKLEHTREENERIRHRALVVEEANEQLGAELVALRTQHDDALRHLRAASMPAVPSTPTNVTSG